MSDTRYRLTPMTLRLVGWVVVTVIILGVLLTELADSSELDRLDPITLTAEVCE